jgi:hypothetical protein
VPLHVSHFSAWHTTFDFTIIIDVALTPDDLVLWVFALEDTSLAIEESLGSLLFTNES